MATVFITGCRQNDSLFVKKSPAYTGITFNNEIKENDSINPIDLEFLYNGGGVAAGDFNNDGLTDLYFTASTTSNRLYLNKGEWKFKDVTDIAKVTGEGRWANAASTIDINNDGLLDIFVTNTIWSDSQQRKDILYVNQGMNNEGVPIFKDLAEEYGIADTSYSVHAVFFDYDNDEDLDMYLLTTKLAKREGARFFTGNVADSVMIDKDKLFRNDWNDSLKHPVFTDVSASAGIIHGGYGLGIAVADINKDGWKDVYVTNDFYGSDLLYMNNRNGTFSEKLGSVVKHSSQNAMGNDVADINNDGLADIIAVDMNPEDNYRKKKNMNSNNYNIYQNMVAGGYNIQYVRNTLQLNMGPAPTLNDSIGDPVFSDISFFSGVAETDWSWNPSLADFDNDGWRDLVVTNGYPRDVTDHDFAAFRGELGNIATKDQLIEQIPQIKIKNYAFRNQTDLTFENVTKKWGLNDVSFSNGAVYADLDNDGDLDYVINNINEEAFVYQNTLQDNTPETAHFMVVNYKGATKNINGLGAFAEIFYPGKGYQVHENFPYRGYLSSVESKTYFGLGKNTTIDSLVITWPDGKIEVFKNLNADTVITADYENSAAVLKRPPKQGKKEFIDITTSVRINYVHREYDFIDFNNQRLLLHKLSQYGPGLAAGDLNGDGLDDLYIGGSNGYPGRFFYQQKDGKFRENEFSGWERKDMQPENMGVLFFDADGDDDLDIYLANGSNEYPDNSAVYQDRFVVNEGGGKMRLDTTALPSNYTSKSCVRAADYDADGDLDLFIGGRVKPGGYPEPVNSFIYRNDSKNGVIKFTDVTEQVAPALQGIGMVCDALWSDFNNDGTPDLVIAGEWMPITFLQNKEGVFSNLTNSSGVASHVGWWNSLAGGDFDNDGDIDYVAGNLGTNSFFKASDEYPITLYAKDFDGNNSIDIVPTLYLPSENGSKMEYPAHTRDDVVEQLPPLKKKFLTYKEFARADIRMIFPGKLDSAYRVRANFMQSAYLQNDGNGKFTIKPLPPLFQFAPVYAFVVEDVNADGFLDIIATGNDYGNEVGNGRYDAFNGLVAVGNGKGEFLGMSINESGFFIPGDGKALVTLAGAGNEFMLAGSQNRGPLKIFRSTGTGKMVRLNNDDVVLEISLRNGATRKHEVYYGTSFLSQSSRCFLVNESIRSIQVINRRGEKRLLQ